MVKKIAKWGAAAIASALLVFLILQCFYLPLYLLRRVEVTPGNEEREGLTVMSTNVRCYSPDDLFKKSWFYRAHLIAEDVDTVKPDIVGFQEVTFVHYDYLVSAMPDYDSEIFYRDDFILSEGCPIFYRRDLFTRIDSGSFWLSETPDVMSKDWGSQHYRIANYVILEEKDSGKRFVVFNTHLDHVSEEARIRGIAVVLDKIAEFGDLPAILMGDLNATPGSETILSTRESFDDAHDIAAVSDEGATFHKWGTQPDRKRIDYILLSKGDAAVSEYRILDNYHADVGAYSADHASIYIRLTLR